MNIWKKKKRQRKLTCKNCNREYEQNRQSSFCSIECRDKYMTEKYFSDNKPRGGVPRMYKKLEGKID